MVMTKQKNKKLKRAYKNVIKTIFYSNLNNMSLDLLIEYLNYFSLFHNKTKKDKKCIKLLSIEINKKWVGGCNE